MYNPHAVCTYCVCNQKYTVEFDQLARLAMLGIWMKLYSINNDDEQTFGWKKKLKNIE